MQQQPQQQQSEIQAEKSGPSASVGVMPPTPTPAEDAATLYTAEDAATLYRAFKGGGCDVGWVLHFLTEHDARHRHLIQQHYKKNYKEDLSDRISSELCMLRTGDLKERIGVDFTVNPTGSFGSSSYIKRAVSLWMLNETERDATIVWQSLQLTSFDKAALTEVICSRTPSQLRSLKDAYFINYGSRLLEDISASTFRFYGYHKELLIVCLDDKAARDEGTNVDRKLAKKDAKQLYKDGEKIWGMNEKTFVDIFTKRNRPHLAAVDAAYDKLYGHSLEVAVENETSGAFKDGLLTLLRCAKNPAKYFAEVLYNSMKGLETLDTTLIRVVVTRAGIDMEDIKKEYKQEYKTSLEDAIHENTCGGYRTFLLLVVETQTQAEETQKMASDTYKDAKQQMEETQKMAMDKYEDTKEETQKMALDTNKDADKVMGTANKKDADKVMGTANKLFVTSNYNNNNAAAARRRPQQKPQGLGQQQSQGKPQQKPQGPGQQQSQGKPQQKPQGLGQQESQEEQQPMESGPTPQPRQKARQLQPPPQQKQSASPTQTQQQPQENKVSDTPPNTQLLPQQQQLEAQAKPIGYFIFSYLIYNIFYFFV